MSAYNEAYDKTIPKLKKAEVIGSKKEAAKAFLILEEYRAKCLRYSQEYMRLTGGTRSGLLFLGKADAYALAAEEHGKKLREWFENE